MEEELKDVFLCFVNLVGEENDGYYRYEFIFTDNPDEVWGDDFEYMPAGMVNDLKPADEYITEIHTVKTKIKLNLIQNNNCFSIQDAMDGCVGIAIEDLSIYSEFPEDGRLVFMFGESLDEVERKLAMKNIIMIN